MLHDTNQNNLQKTKVNRFIKLKMKILIAADSFKNALGTVEVCHAIERGCKTGLPKCSTMLFPIADGGEGTADVIRYHLGYEEVRLKVVDPLFRPLESTYLISNDQKIAFVELASASGLELLLETERNPMISSTYGTGLMIMDAIRRNVKHIILSIGGSATNDGGIGLASALGYKFLDDHDQPLKGTGSDLLQIKKIQIEQKDLETINSVKFEVMCDVINPLFGENGAAYVYGPQKGADQNMVTSLDTGLKHLSRVSGDEHLTQIKGAGAAGGVGFGAMAFLNASLVSGINTVINLTGFEQYVRDTDVIITGEGKLDAQTSQGKLIYGICRLAEQYNKPVIALCGIIDCSPEDIEDLGLISAFSIQRNISSLKEALSNTAENLEYTASQVIKLIAISQK